MNEIIYLVLGIVGGSAAGAFGFNAYKNADRKKRIGNAKTEADRILNNARNEAQRLDRDAKNRAKDIEFKTKKNAEQDIDRQKKSLQSQEKSFKDKENRLDGQFKEKEQKLEQRLSEVSAQAEKVKIAETRMADSQTKVEEKIQELKHKIENIAGMTVDSAKKELVEVAKREAALESAKAAAEIEKEAKEEAEKRAKRIISMAISRYSGEYVVERTVSVVSLPNEEMKGKIIGREGRNIRAIEAACGVDLIIDDTPEAVVISGFDPVRREVAKRTLDKLMEDGRIHPGKIEDVVERIKSDLFKSIQEDGQKAMSDLGITGVHPEIVKLVGSLKYRYSYTQDNYSHSIECGFIAGMMAAELGVDVKLARRCGVLHDIGKALDHSVEGSHAVIGADFAKRHGEPEAVVHAIRAHHEDEKPNTVYAFLAQASDALSGARPGARQHMTENYVRRLEDLEAIGNSFDGVIRTFAVQAGRELRVLVEASRVTDEQSLMLSRDIARKIEREMTYPGQIKITVIRETRSIEHAR